MGNTVGRGFRLAAMTLALGGAASLAAAQDMPPAIAPQPADPAQQTAAVAAPPVAIPPAPAADATPPATAAAPAPAGQPAPAAQPMSQAQLDRLLAPVALYPDPLLSQVLMSSTYPLEIVEEARWIREPANASLTGEVLTNALKQQGWDPSVMALAPFPRLPALMADKLEWTEQLGNAFLAQQSDVTSAVQRLRHEAMAAGNLKATPECHCAIQTSGETISIMPSDSHLVCIPVYNPTVAYGAWAEPDHPPVAFPVPAGFAYEPGLAIGFYPVVEVAAFGPLWGWGSFDWEHGSIVVDNTRFGALAPGHPAFAGGVWVHDPAHRGGVAYRDPAVTARFGAARAATVGVAGQAAVAHGVGAGLRHQAVFGPGAAFGGPGRHGGSSQGGGFARGQGFAGRGGWPMTRAQFSPGPRAGFGSPHGGGGLHDGGGPHGGGGGPHDGGDGHHH
jgi:Protein of unknown function (DUF3300)